MEPAADEAAQVHDAGQLEEALLDRRDARDVRRLMRGRIADVVPAHSRPSMSTDVTR